MGFQDIERTRFSLWYCSLHPSLPRPAQIQRYLEEHEVHEVPFSLEVCGAVPLGRNGTWELTGFGSERGKICVMICPEHQGLSPHTQRFDPKRWGRVPTGSTACGRPTGVDGPGAHMAFRQDDGPSFLVGGPELMVQAWTASNYLFSRSFPVTF